MDRFVPRDDAKRLWGQSQERVQRKVFRVWERLRLSGLQGQTKRLTFREGRLRLPIGTTRLESQAFRWPCGGPMVLALIFWSFLVKQKGQENECAQECRRLTTSNL